VTPAELLVEMQRRYRVAQDLPRVMVDAAKVSTSRTMKRTRAVTTTSDNLTNLLLMLLFFLFHVFV
jgi:hypothetical protein